mgnify:CR=1 FL=1
MALHCATDTLPDGEAGRAEFSALFRSLDSLGEFIRSTVEFDGNDYQEPYTGCRKILMFPAEERYMPKDRGIGRGPKEIRQKYWRTRTEGRRKFPEERLSVWVIPEHSVFFCGIYPKAASRIAVKQH